MIESREIIDPLYDRCEAELFNPPAASWKDEWRKIRDDFLAVEQSQYKNPSSERLFRQRFQEPGTVVFLLRDTLIKKVVGFTYSIPLVNYAAGNGENFRKDIEREDDGRKTAYIMSTVILPDYTGHRLSPKLIGTLEDFLKERRGYRFVEFDVTKENGYADKVVENNKDRIVAGPISHDSSLGPQVFCRIKL